MPDTVVYAELQTSAQAIRPGGTFLIAVRFDIHPGYRISWTNPGDQGRSTRVELQAPPGFEVGAVQFPAPRRFELPGGFVSYGYEQQTAVFLEVTAPRKLSSSRAYRFDVKADWLACKDECASEELSAWFELLASHRAPAPRLPSELRDHHAALPSAFADLPESNHDWNGTPRRPALRLSASEVKWVDFFPGDDPPPTLLAVQPRGDVLEMRFERLRSEGNLRGLAFGEVDGRLASFDVNVPLPH
jgi:thiol:disulfide interchange protein DsbD